MNKRTAKVLGRFCEKHQEVNRRVALPTGDGWVTGCPGCLASPEMKRALNELVKAALAHHFGTRGEGQ